MGGDDRYVVISADCHAFGPGNGSNDTVQLPQLLGYFDPEYRTDYEGYIADAREVFEQRQRMASLFAGDALDSFAEQSAVLSGGSTGLFDSGRRLAELEADGIVAEVLFPNGVPFNEGLGEDRGAELRAAGARAYNRWLADFCAPAHDRRAGLALVPLLDVDDAVRDVHWAREHGLRGVVIPTSWQAVGIPPYYDPCYEPFWAACAEASMPVHAHGGAADVAGYGDYGPESMLTYALEATCFYAQRPFWYLMWGGVFERHPELTLVLTESRVDWVPYILFFCDRLYHDKLFAHIKEKVTREPSDYFRRNVVLGASMMNRHEAELRHEIGLDKLMWGADYPHYEGTWPSSLDWQKAAFGGLPTDDVQAILGGNAARVYGFDVEALRSVAGRVGPRIDEIHDAAGDAGVWRW